MNTKEKNIILARAWKSANELENRMVTVDQFQHEYKAPESVVAAFHTAKMTLKISKLFLEIQLKNQSLPDLKNKSHDKFSNIMLDFLSEKLPEVDKEELRRFLDGGKTMDLYQLLTHRDVEIYFDDLFFSDISETVRLSCKAIKKRDWRKTKEN
jgi:hypothetical protein